MKINRFPTTRYLIFLLLIQTTACQTLMFWKDDPQTEQTDENLTEEEKLRTKEVKRVPVLEEPKFVERTSTVQDLDLKVAKLWSKVDELESINNRMIQRIKLLEKGIVTGMVPEELKDKNSGRLLVPKDNFFKRTAPSPSQTLSQTQDSSTAPVAKISEEQAEELEDLFEEAQGHYQEGEFGKAILTYAEIDRNFPSAHKEGTAKFWIAKSWFEIKDYQTAREHFNNFINNYQGSEWIPRAKLDLARIEWKLGLQRTALQRLRSVISDHPRDDAAELAKSELKNLDQKL